MDGRDLALQRLVEQLGATRVGRRFDLERISTFDDFRESVPIHETSRHQTDVEPLLGFGLDGDDASSSQLSGAAIERDRVLQAWRHHLPSGEVKRLALLRNDQLDAASYRVLREDLLALDAETLHVSRLTEPASIRDALKGFGPQLLAASSALVVPWLQRGRPETLEQEVDTLVAVACEYDIAEVHHSPLSLFSAGWTHRGVRIGLPSVRGPREAVTLAVGTSLIELLPYSNPEEDGRRVYARKTLLPEQALVGGRYEVVLSASIGLLRLRTEEHVRVVGFDPPTPEAPRPRPRVVRLSPPPADVALEGCTVAGSWLTASVRQSLTREDPVLLAGEVGPDPRSIPRGPSAGSLAVMLRQADAFGETEFGAAITRTGMRRGELPRRPRALLCRLELQGFVRRELAAKLSDRIDQSLRARSPAYAWLRQGGELLPPRVVIAALGRRGEDELGRLTQLCGPVRQPQIRVSGD